MAKLDRDARRITDAAGGAIDVAVVLGSGLSNAFGNALGTTRIAYDAFKTLPNAALPGHGGYALAGSLHGARTLAFAGRAHLYQGFSARDVTAGVRLAHAAGARTIVLTNAAGALRADLMPGDLMLIVDHINLTGRTPLEGDAAPSSFVNMRDAYAQRLRAVVDDGGAAEALKKGVYAGVSGPQFETAAECRYLRDIGADAVGMSTVLETIQARALGMEVLGISVITNLAGDGEAGHDDVTAVAEGAAARIAGIVISVAQTFGAGATMPLAR